MFLHTSFHRPESGFTLLELIIILVLASIVAAMASRPIVGALKSAAIFQEEVDVREEAYYTLTRMGQEVREGKGNVTCNSTQLRVSGGKKFSINGNQLELNGSEIFSGIDDSQDLCDDEYEDIGVYILSLKLENGGGRELELAVFQRNSN